MEQGQMPENKREVRELATKLRQKRERLGLSQREAARAAKMSYGTYVTAETYGRMGLKVVWLVQRWLESPDLPPSKEKKGAPAA